MIVPRRREERGHFNHGWLDTSHTFSFASYLDPAHMGFRALRVINEDRVEPGKGFPTHSHADMEIVSYVLAGALEHKDSLGTGSVIRPGEVQRMSAGTGVTHSEFNASQTEPLHFLQIWILPEKRGIAPSYEQRMFSPGEREGRLRLVASRGAREGSLRINQDVDFYASLLAPGQAVAHILARDRHAWLQVARGEVQANGTPLRSGDGAALSGERALEIASEAGAEVLLFDLA